MLELAPQNKTYSIVAIGTILKKESGVAVRCELCGVCYEDTPQQKSIDKVFECISTHMPSKYVYAIYEQRGNKIVTSINKAAWEKAKRSTKFKK